MQPAFHQYLPLFLPSTMHSHLSQHRTCIPDLVACNLCIAVEGPGVRSLHSGDTERGDDCSKPHLFNALLREVCELTNGGDEVANALVPQVSQAHGVEQFAHVIVDELFDHGRF